MCHVTLSRCWRILLTGRSLKDENDLQVALLTLMSLWRWPMTEVVRDSWKLLARPRTLSLSLRRASFVAFICSILPTKLECGQAHDDVDRRRPNLPTACSISLLSHDDFVGRADRELSSSR